MKTAGMHGSVHEVACCRTTHTHLVTSTCTSSNLQTTLQVYMTDVVDTIADLMEQRPRPRGGRQQQQDQGRVGWHDVRQRLELKFGAPFEDLCVRLPEGDKGMGIFITSRYWLLGRCMMFCAVLCCSVLCSVPFWAAPCGVRASGPMHQVVPVFSVAVFLQRFSSSLPWQCWTHSAAVTRPLACRCCSCTDMVLGWKSEREQHHARVKTLSLEKKMLAGRCTAELHEVAQNMVLGHARTLQGLVADRLQALQAAANRAVAVFINDVSGCAA